MSTPSAPNHSPFDYDVSIVGYGPVGAFAALLLAESGHRVSIHERSADHLQLPRAVGLDGESLRAFQSIGHGEAIDAIVQPPREGDALWFTNSKREKLFGQDIPGELGHNGWRDLAFFDQPDLEAELRSFVSENDLIDVFLGETATAVAQDEDAVDLTLEDRRSESTRYVRCRYLLGCDGASSFVRRTLDIPWTSLGYDQDWLVLDILLKPSGKLPIQTMQVCDPDRLTTYVCVKDPNRRWEFQLKPGETREEMETDEKIHSLLDSWIPREDYTIRRAAVYQFHAATAERWRDHRVLLAGDSAHQTPPFLGQGLNSGIRDSFNISWKLDLVLRGIASADLLDSYFDERDAHARKLVDGAVGIGKLMETLAAAEAGRPEPYPGWSMANDIGDGRVAVSIKTGALLTEQVERGFPIGEPVRQPVLKPTSGGDRPRNMDEWLGRGCSIVARSKADLAVSAAGQSIIDALEIKTLALSDYEVVVGETDHIFERTPAAILRPDRYLFGVVEEDLPIDALLARLAESVSLDA